ncbi:MAG: MBL fold metallo-hydrolase [Desulfamplus sp.]|nr:MBL fold metallo-hydrolase [Desulfamplus sp.]MBF0242954.1 MBL fold metallo-hydrolase [Desulfamplus sp.]MBF0390883.1 MBL fold metallo-hydrolase [Desulfamplus sp.]
MIIETLEVGPIMANCYIVGCENTKEAVVIDPGDDADDILMALSKHGLKVKYLINTHGHFDHVGANKRMKEVTKADIMIHADDEPMLSQLGRSAASFGLAAENSPAADRHLKDGDEIKFGDITLKVIHTPGHSKGGCCLYTDGHVFVGDTLFYGSIGRTDLPGGNYNTLISSIKTKLFKLADNTIVHTGHGPETTILREKQTNPFLI